MKNLSSVIHSSFHCIAIFFAMALLGTCNNQKTFGPAFLTIKGQQVQVRAQAHLDSAIIFQLDFGDRVSILDRTTTKEAIRYFGYNCWYKIKKEDQEGWIYGGLTSLAEGGIYGQQKGALFDKDLANILGEVYDMAGILNEDYRQLERFVSSNTFFFSQNSNLMIGAQGLGQLATKRAVEIFDKDAYNRARAQGYSQQQAQERADWENRESIQLGRVGEELVWLSQVLPAAAAGNWTPFNNTGTDRRRQGRAQWLQLRQFMQGSDVGQIVDQIMGSGGIIEKDYIVNLALESGI